MALALNVSEQMRDIAELGLLCTTDALKWDAGWGTHRSELKCRGEVKLKRASVSKGTAEVVTGRLTERQVQWAMKWESRLVERVVRSRQTMSEEKQMTSRRGKSFFTHLPVSSEGPELQTLIWWLVV